jgi:hypothetical protein
MLAFALLAIVGGLILLASPTVKDPVALRIYHWTGWVFLSLAAWVVIYNVGRIVL